MRIRLATKDDAKIIAELSLIADGGIAEYLLTGVVPNLTPLQMMRFQFSNKELPFTYRCCYLAEHDGNILGLAHIYSNELNKLPSPTNRTPPVLFERLNYISAFLHKNAIQNSLYLNSLAVFEKYRGKGVGKKLLDFVIKNAKKKKFSSVLLHVWSDNVKAIDLYQQTGFNIIEHIDIQRQPFLPHDGGMELMQIQMGGD